MFAMRTGGNNCGFCGSRLCGDINKPKISDKKDCLVFNNKKPIPASATEAERNYIVVNRAYLC